MATSNSIPETGITFFRSGGHKHDGVTSSLIDYTKYSIFDFGPDISTSNTDVGREIIRLNNQNRFNNYINNFISTQILAPAGIELAPNSVRGVHLAANEITANNIAANTITAGQIAAGTITATQIASNTITAGQIAADTITGAQIAANTITADELVTNVVLVNNIIQSSTYTVGSAGWIIRNNGFAEFNNVTVRGTVSATAGNVGGWNINSSNITNSDNTVTLYSNGTINGSAIIGGSITGATIISNTFTSGDRVSIASNQLNLYNVSNQVVAKIVFNNSNTALHGRIESVGGGGISLYASAQTGTAQYITGTSSEFPKFEWFGYGSTIAHLSKNGSGSVGVLDLIGGELNASKINLSGTSNGYYLTDRSLSLNWAMYVTGGFWRIYNALYGDIFALSSNDWYVYTLQNDPGSTVYLKYYSNGQISKSASKKELKTNINYDISGLSLVNKLKPAHFTWKSSQENNYGFIAEDVAEVDNSISILEPIITNDMSDDEKQSAFDNKESWIPSYYSETGILALAIKSIQELDAKIKDLEAKLGYTE